MARFRGKQILRVEGFKTEYTAQNVPWMGKEALLENLASVEEQADKINYLNHSEYHFKGWRWPTTYRNEIQIYNVRPSTSFEAMVKRER